MFVRRPTVKLGCGSGIRTARSAGYEPTEMTASLSRNIHSYIIHIANIAVNYLNGPCS